MDAGVRNGIVVQDGDDGIEVMMKYGMVWRVRVGSLERDDRRRIPRSWSNQAWWTSSWRRGYFMTIAWNACLHSAWNGYLKSRIQS
jgi:hypothetical protein